MNIDITVIILLIVDITIAYFGYPLLLQLLNNPVLVALIIVGIITIFTVGVLVFVTRLNQNRKNKIS